MPNVAVDFISVPFLSSTRLREATLFRVFLLAAGQFFAPLLHLLIPHLQNINMHLLRFPLERESLSHVSTPVAFQHLGPGSPNGAAGYPECSDIHTFDHTPPILIGFSP
ncbi:hypothetical protein AVEN_188417-1 [Araneus ventricosus]|uniref:Uncharacterized protein n=1 Tax=Araneus ventricosus TaxID=182803 RepID=A0A4Y2KBW2_ARAVE|nr:hypothetical protein AVEN_188417-1 [Araneus ventricosus]